MLPFLLPLLLSQLHGAPPSRPTKCQELQRIELSRVSGSAPEICVNPRLMTGLRFDAPVVVELQDEVRFQEVARGPTSLQLLPPQDMLPGERLRMSLRYLDGSSPDGRVLILVATEDQAARQVEVFRDQRSRESLVDELVQERAKGQRLEAQVSHLKQELEELRARVAEPSLLVGWVLASQVQGKVSTARRHRMTLTTDTSKDAPELNMVFAFRLETQGAFQLIFDAHALDSWRGLELSVWDARGQHARVVQTWVGNGPVEKLEQQVIVEFMIAEEWPHGDISLRMQDAADHGMTFMGMSLPEPSVRELGGAPQ